MYRRKRLEKKEENMPKIVAQKEDWIKLGYQLFTQQGEKGIVVETMAKKLKCNKSSFYWHFKTKKDFIRQLVNVWVEQDTAMIMATVQKFELPTEQFEALITSAFQKDNNLDFIFFLKRYALKHTAIQTIIDQVDQERLAFTAALFEKLGNPKEGVERQARLFYKYLIGYHEMIRYKKQEQNFVEEIKKELRLFLKF